MSRRLEIMDEYWIEFLKWYKSYKDKKYWNGASHVLRPVENLFWYWLVEVKADSANSDDFMESL